MAVIHPGRRNDAAALARGGFAEVSDWVTRAADLVPAERYGYRPVETVRTFGQLVGHLADSYNYYCGRAAGRNVEWADPVEKGSQDKTVLIRKLKEATGACTAAYAGAVGLAYRRHAIVARLSRQSRNRNSGPDLTSDARRFVSVGWEFEGLRSGVHERQGVLRLGLGRVIRDPFLTAWFVDAAAVLRYRVAPILAFLGTVQYAPVAIPEEHLVACGPGPGPYSYLTSCYDSMVDGRVQHNFGFQVGLELRPLGRWLSPIGPSLRLRATPMGTLKLK